MWQLLCPGCGWLICVHACSTDIEFAIHLCEDGGKPSEKTVVFTCDGDMAILKFFKEVMHKAERHWSDDTDMKDLSVDYDDDACRVWYAKVGTDDWTLLEHLRSPLKVVQILSQSTGPLKLMTEARKCGFWKRADEVKIEQIKALQAKLNAAQALGDTVCVVHSLRRFVWFLIGLFLVTPTRCYLCLTRHSATTIRSVEIFCCMQHADACTGRMRDNVTLAEQEEALADTRLTCYTATTLRTLIS